LISTSGKKERLSSGFQVVFLTAVALMAKGIKKSRLTSPGQTG